MDSRTLSRRSYLRCSAVLGASALSAGCSNIGGKSVEGDTGTITMPRNVTPQDSSKITSSIDFQIIHISPGEKFTTDIHSGEEFANKVIDISAPGATFKIEATGSDWVLRNVGVSGVWDVEEDAEPFSVAVDSGSTGIIQNVYFADPIHNDTLPGISGIYVKSHHAGRLVIDRINMQGMAGNAVYASTPGYPDDNPQGLHGGGQGVVEITNSYAKDCHTSHFRVGTTGSLVQNCVAAGGARGIWAKYNEGITVHGCDFSGHMTNRGDGDVVCGENVDWGPSADAEVTLTDMYFGTTAPGDQGINYPGNIIGQSRTDAPRRTEPEQVEGVPLSAAEAAAGTFLL